MEDKNIAMFISMIEKSEVPVSMDRIGPLEAEKNIS